MKTLCLKDSYSIENISQLHRTLELGNYDFIDYREAKIDEYTKIYIESFNNNVIFKNDKNLFLDTYFSDNFLAYFIDFFKFSKIILFKNCEHDFQKKYFYNDIMANFYIMFTESVFTICSLSFMIGISLAYHSLNQLMQLGVDLYAVNLLVSSFFKEVGILVSIIVLSAKFGSGAIAKIGFMRISFEWNALKIMKIDPDIFLLKSKLIAFIILFPILSYISIIFGSLGGFFLLKLTISMSFRYFLSLIYFDLITFLNPIIKGLILGLVLGIVICYEASNINKTSDDLVRCLSRGVSLVVIFCIFVDSILNLVFRL